MYWRLHRYWHNLTVDPVLFLGKYCECLRLLDVSQFTGYTQGSRCELDIIQFEERQRPMLNHAPPLPSQDNHYICHLQQIAIGSAFEKCMPTIRGRWKVGRINHPNWPPVILLAYHLRNGCFHGNKFTFNKSIFPSSWRGFTLSNADANNQVTGLSNGGLGLADVLALLRDMSVEIS